MRLLLEALQRVANLNEMLGVRTEVPPEMLCALLLFRRRLSRALTSKMYCRSLRPQQHTRHRKQNATVSSHAFWSYGTCLFQKLRSMHSTACDRLPLSFDNFLLTEVPQKKTSLMPVKKTYIARVSILSCVPADKKGILAARAKALTPRAARGFKKHFSVGREVVPTACVAEKSPLPSTLRELCRPEKRTSPSLSRCSLGLAYIAPPHNERRSSLHDVEY